MLFVFVVPVTAVSVDYDFSIVGSNVVAEKTVDFQRSVTGNYTFSVPNDAKGVSLYVDGELVEYSDVLVLEDNQEVKVSYVTKKYLDESNFVFDLKPDFDGIYNINLVLPEGAVLKTGIENGRSTSIFPDADLITTDGKSIVIEWSSEDIKESDDVNFFVRFRHQKYSFLWVVVVLAGVLVFFAAKFVIFANKKVDEIIVDASKTFDSKTFEGHLKQPEEQVVNVLKLKEGACEQGTLRVATGFSKASLSRVLKELEDRKVIYKEKRGKKNLVFLRKD